MMWHIDEETNRLVPGLRQALPTYDLPDNLQPQPQTREELVGRMQKLRQNIRDIFTDAEHWNLTHLDEEPIDPDPDGLLARIAAALDVSLAAEEPRQCSGLS
jgi:hypothetical protein